LAVSRIASVRPKQRPERGDGASGGSSAGQTDRLFDHQIVERMGTDFYKEVFVPAVRHEREVGHSYESMCDRIRRRWKPAPL
jgi:hypothetical protein